MAAQKALCIKLNSAICTCISTIWQLPRYLTADDAACDTNSLKLSAHKHFLEATCQIINTITHQQFFNDKFTIIIMFLRKEDTSAPPYMFCRCLLFKLCAYINMSSIRALKIWKVHSVLGQKLTRPKNAVSLSKIKSLREAVYFIYTLP